MRILGTICLVLAFGAGIAGAQQAAEMSHEPAPALQQKGTGGPLAFDVVVTDKSGKPVEGLQQSDFQLFDQGKPAQIVGFREFDPTTDQQNPPQVIILLDGVNTSFTGISLAREQIESFLHKDQGQLPARFSVDYLTDKGLEEVGQPTTDGNALAQLLHSKQGELRDINRSAGFYGAVERMQISLKGMQEITAHEMQVPGRKLLIWISPGWAVFDNPNVILSARDQRGIFGSLIAFSGGLRQAQMTVYMVDPLGTWDAGSMRSFLWQNFVKPVTKPDQANPGDLGLQVLASQTGGRALWGSNDVAGEIAKCADDAKVWYRISFNPQPGKEGPTWHGVEVKVTKPGLKVSTRNGYYALP